MPTLYSESEVNESNFVGAFEIERGKVLQVMGFRRRIGVSFISDPFAIDILGDSHLSLVRVVCCSG